MRMPRPPAAMAAALLLLAGCGQHVPTVAEQAKGAGAAPPPARVAVSSASASGSSRAHGTPTPSASVSAPACQGSADLAFGFGAVRAADGQGSMVVSMRNCTTDTFTLPKVPQFTASTADGQSVDITWTAGKEVGSRLTKPKETRSLTLTWQLASSCSAGAQVLGINVRGADATTEGCLRLGRNPQQASADPSASRDANGEVDTSSEVTVTWNP